MPITVAAGLLVRSATGGIVSAAGGDALYAVLVYLLVALVVPDVRPVKVAGVAWVLCAMVELAQLVGLSAAVVTVWEPARWVLGTTFHGPDLVAYAAAAALAAVIDLAAGAAVRRRGARGIRRSQ